MEQRISWWIVSSGERGEIVKSGRPVDSLSVVFPIGPLRSLARKPVRRPALCLRRSLSSPLSLALSFSLSLPARPLPPRLQPRVTCRPFLVCIASSSPSSSRLANVHVPPSSRWLLVSTLHFSVYAANCTATARIEGRVRSSKQAGRAARQAFLSVARCGV